jgi:catechol 2,3-dioxygenase-like lactoylglutathione lyase family enzyme
MEQQTGTRITSVRTVAIPVSDQQRAVDFYLGALGFEKRLDAAFGPGLRWVEVAPPGSSTSLALVLPGEGHGVGVDTGVRLSTSDADEDHAHLRACGVDTDPQVLRMAGGVPPMFSFRDPDGNTLYVVQAP